MSVSRLRIVVYPDSPKSWTARSLEHDISVAGPSAEAAIDSLVRIAEAHIAFDVRHGRPPLSAFTSAPRVYWNAFARAETPQRVRPADPAGTLQYIVNMIPQNPIVTAYSQQVRIA
jgi:hypothetical protein